MELEHSCHNFLGHTVAKEWPTACSEGIPVYKRESPLEKGKNSFPRDSLVFI
jgi:hypothetical protein